MTTYEAIETMIALGIDRRDAAQLAHEAEQCSYVHAVRATRDGRQLQVTMARHHGAWNAEFASYVPEHGCGVTCHA